MRSDPFYIENIIYLSFKTTYLKEEVNCTEPSPSVSIPCFITPRYVLVKTQSPLDKNLNHKMETRQFNFIQGDAVFSQFV